MAKRSQIRSTGLGNARKNQLVHPKKTTIGRGPNRKWNDTTKRSKCYRKPYRGQG